ncbi:MAG: hypothetical protein K5662_00340 [Lachnospiraceae bacterium]|nr:hypothetical protein [Lachnospiraceae bacterium]
MAYSMALNAVYNQYLTTYAPKKSDTKYDTHKRSELKSITNSMAKLNKEAPLYKIENNGETREYIVGLKEESRLLQNTITETAGNSNSIQLDGKIVYSTNENILSATYVGIEDQALIGDRPDSDGNVPSGEVESPTYDIEVLRLASAQVNQGKFLPKNERAIEPGDYTFDLSVNGQGYEFQYGIRVNDTNFDIQQRLSRLINNADIRLTSSVEEDGEGNAALRIESTQVGVHSGESTRVFNIRDAGGRRGSGSVEYLGIDSVVREASNAVMNINGIEVSVPDNTFVLEKNFEITLNGVSSMEGETVRIGLKPDTEAAVENIDNFFAGINHFMDAVSSYSDNQTRANALLDEIKSAASYYRAGMEGLGIEMDDNGRFVLNKDKLYVSILTDEDEVGAKALKGFADTMMRKSKQVSINPINYLNKKVVEYKNPGKNFLSPYVASAYAGLMFNDYC